MKLQYKFGFGAVLIYTVFLVVYAASKADGPIWKLLLIPTATLAGTFVGFVVISWLSEWWKKRLH